MPPRKTAPQTIALRKMTISPWKFPPRKIAFRICCLHNCPKENCGPPPPTQKLSQGYIIHNIYFSQESEIIVLLSIIASSSFPSLWFKLVLDFDFCMKKIFINTVRLKLLKKEEQVKNKLSME